MPTTSPGLCPVTRISFSGDRFADRHRIVPLRRGVDSRLEPMPFRPEQFAEGGNLIDEIKRTGVRVGG